MSDQFRDIIRIGIQEYGDKIADKIKERLRKLDKKATGETIESVKAIVEEVGEEFKIKIEADKALQYIDAGRRKGAKPPPFKPIYQWVKVKRFQFRNRETGQWMTYRQTAWATVHGIAKNGIKPTYVVSKAMREVDGELDPIEEAYLDYVERKILFTFNQRNTNT